jgi:hypothetical protein
VPKGRQAEALQVQTSGGHQEAKGKAESVVAKGKAKAGKAVIVSLKPKKKFQRKLASASRILVRQTLVINGAKQTGYRTLKVVR